MTITDYEKQGTDFLEKHGVKMTTEFLYNGPYFLDEKEKRDVYSITLVRDKKSYSFRFGQSIANSGLTVKRNPYGKSMGRAPTLYDNEMIPRRPYGRVIPTAYDVLSAIQKSDVGTFEDFCGEFSYDTDSRKAENIYFAVQTEYSALRKMFSQAELDEMNEIE